MWGTELQLLLMLVLILASSLILTNALEHLGHRAGISAGVVGSVFAAVATALPETMVPILALLAGGGSSVTNQAVSVGAILGAPLMISTLSTCVMGCFAMSSRGLRGWIDPEHTGFMRDLNFFIAAFLIAALAMYLPFKPLYLRGSCSLTLICLYLVYLRTTFKASKQLVLDGHGVEADAPLFLSRLGMKDTKVLIGAQLLLGLAILFWGARGFIHGVEQISKAYQVSPLLLSLLIIPIATELPEKMNSIIWVRKKKDTLAFGNLTGAMVFQGTLLPALGVFLLSWQPNKEVFPGIVLSLMAAAWLKLSASARGLPLLALWVNGLLYLLYLYMAIH